jgi:hypothetical protein
MKNGQSRQTGNIGYTRHKKKTNKTKNTTQKTRKLSNTNPTKNTTQKTRKLSNTNPTKNPGAREGQAAPASNKTPPCYSMRIA